MRGLEVVSWIISIIVTSVCALVWGIKDEVAEQVCYVFGSMLFSFCFTISIFRRYANFQFFPISAILNIGATFFLSFVQIGIAATDITFTKRRRELKDKDNEWLKTFMDILWFVVFWASMICGSVLMQFYKRYWISGAFSASKRIAFAMKRILILALVGILLLVVFGGFLYYLNQQELIW